MYERDVPNVAGSVANPMPTETGANGAYCKAGEVTCTAGGAIGVAFIWSLTSS